MTIKKKILLNSLIGLVLSILMIAFIIFRMLSIQTSNQDYVKVLLTVGSLKAETNASMQSLNTFAFNMTDANKNIAINDLENTGATYKELDSILKEKQSRKVLKGAETKFKILQKEAIAGLTDSNASEVKRQSLRTKGIANDIYLLDLYTTEHYTYLEESMESDIEFVIIFALIGSVIVALITILLILRMANKITNPLKKLAENAKEIAAGNLLFSHVDYKHNDELGILNHSFTKMVDQLTSILTSVDTASQRIDQFALEFELEYHSLTESSNQVAVSTDELSRGTQSISEDLQSSVELVELMDKEFGKNVARAQQSAEYAHGTNVVISAGREAINEQKSLITKNMKATRTIEAATKDFSIYAGKIEDMAKAVSEIANQTNLLALNAAIEAARAGEAGKGFAVVSDEVRKLAEHSTEATKQIFETVNLIKNGLTSISSSVEVGVGITDQQNTNINRTLETFEQIEEKVTGISEVLDHLVTGVDTSKKSNEHVLQNVESISAIVEETAAGSEEISASTVEQLHSITKVVGKVASLKELTESLNKTISHFQLKK